MVQRFGKETVYFGGRVTKVTSGSITVVRFNGAPVYERCGDTRRLFGKIHLSFSKIFESGIVFLVGVLAAAFFTAAAFIVMIVAFVRAVTFFVKER